MQITRDCVRNSFPYKFQFVISFPSVPFSLFLLSLFSFSLLFYFLLFHTHNAASSLVQCVCLCVCVYLYKCVCVFAQSQFWWIILRRKRIAMGELKQLIIWIQIISLLHKSFCFICICCVWPSFLIQDIPCIFHNPNGWINTYRWRF